MINANRKCSLNGVEYLTEIATQIVTPDEITELKRLINLKYDKRIELYDKGIKQWDTTTSVIMILRGVK